MKKLLITVFSVLMLMTALFSVPADAATTYTLKKGTPVSVKVDEGKYVWCVFTPAKSGWYSFYSSGDRDTVATLYSGGKFSEVDYNDDGGDEGNFEINAYLFKGTKYYLKVSQYVLREMECTVTVDDGYSEYAEAAVRYVVVEYGKNAKLQVVGTVTEDPSITYKWYKLTYDYDTRQYSQIEVSGTSPTLTVKNVKKAMEYCCVLSHPELDDQYIYFDIGVKNNFSIDLKTIIPNGEAVFVLGDTFKAEVKPHGDDLSGVKYYWAVENPLASSEEEALLSYKKTTKPTSTVPVSCAYEMVSISAVDKYSNVSQVQFTIFKITDTLMAGSSSSCDGYGYHGYTFIPAAGDDYQIYTEESTGAYKAIYVFSSEGRWIDSVSGYDDLNCEVWLQGGSAYYVMIYVQDDAAFTVGVNGTSSGAPVTAGNAGESVIVGWSADSAAQKSNLYRREQGTEEWTTVATDLTSPVYEDTAALLMGVTYEYCIRTYNGTSWSDYSSIASVIRNPFYDVSEVSIEFGPIAWAKNNGVVNGIDTTHFGPYNPVQRQHFAIMLWRFAGQPKGGTSNPFTDIGSCNATAKKAILWASGKGIIKGTKSGGKTYFKPTDYITREQILIMLQRFAGKSAANVTEEMLADLRAACADDFDALGCKASSINAMAWAYANGLLDGVAYNDESGKIWVNPKENCIRADLCTLLKNFNTNIKKYK